MGKQLKKFATQVDESVLLELRALAKSEGRQLQSIVEEAFKNFLEEKQGKQIRSNVLAAIDSCHSKYAGLLQELAK